MNILHYSLGIPPYRTGGLTKYSFDLMKEQVRNGDKVYLLFPGRIYFLNNKTRIKYYKNEYGVNVHEVINSLPVPLLNGIHRPQKFMKVCDKGIYIKFLLENNIQIVHIHTLMGLHKEFLESCSELNIKKVYTTHDYFGICTKVNFIDNQGNLCEERDLEKCLKCNKSGYSMKTIMVLQSPIYRLLKNKGIIAKLKLLVLKVKGNKYVNPSSSNEELEITAEYRNDYNKLINYYSDMFNYIDRFLFNSSISKQIYKQYFDVCGDVVSITHGDISDNRKIRHYSPDKLRLTYMGPDKKYKGFNLLIDTMKELNKEYESSIELNLYGDIREFKIGGNIKTHGRYSYNQLNDIFDNTDLLIVPSICNETFGFIVLEAISYGVPVLMTDKVGSKDIVISNKINIGILIKPSKQELKTKIIKIIKNRDILKTLNKNIVLSDFNHYMCNQYNEVNHEYVNINNDNIK